MAEKTLEELPEFGLGDKVRIKNYSGPPGKIVELRGPLGPKGMNIYRVAIPQKPGVFFVELRGNQLELIPTRPRRSFVIKPGKAKHLKRRIKGGLGSLS